MDLPKTCGRGAVVAQTHARPEARASRAAPDPSPRQAFSAGRQDSSPPFAVRVQLGSAPGSAIARRGRVVATKLVAIEASLTQMSGEDDEHVFSRSLLQRRGQ